MIKRYTFHFSARVTKDIEVPDGCEAGDDAFEAAMNHAVDCIDVDRYAECDEIREAKEGTPVSK